jgi:phage terminase large subunit
MRSQGYTPDRVQIILPHDGSSHDKVYDVSYESAFRAAGYDVLVIPNQGKGAAMQRVEASRRLFPSMWFNEATTGPLLDALGWYHEKRDPERNIGLGPEHDWSSNGADAFGLGSVAYDEPRQKRQDEEYYGNYRGAGGWMGG